MGPENFKNYEKSTEETVGEKAEMTAGETLLRLDRDRERINELLKTVEDEDLKKDLMELGEKVEEQIRELTEKEKKAA